jgi:hypothetical protein
MYFLNGTGLVIQTGTFFHSALIRSFLDSIPPENRSTLNLSRSAPLMKAVQEKRKYHSSLFCDLSLLLG